MFKSSVFAALIFFGFQTFADGMPVRLTVLNALNLAKTQSGWSVLQNGQVVQAFDSDREQPYCIAIGSFNSGNGDGLISFFNDETGFHAKILATSTYTSISCSSNNDNLNLDSLIATLAGTVNITPAQ